MDLDRKDVKLILTERVGTDLDCDQKGANGLWQKECKWSWTKGCDWIVTKRLRMDRGRKISNSSWPKSAHGRDRKVANGLWPKKFKRVMTKKGCERIVTERVWTICYRKSVNGSWLKGSERAVTKGVSPSMDQNQRGKNESLLKMCERNITKRMLKVNHDVGDIRVWSFLANIKSLFKTTTNIYEVLIYRYE